MFADFCAATIRQAVKAQVVLARLNLGEEVPFKGFELHQIDLALKYGLLHPLAPALAYLGDLPEAAPAGLGFGIHVVADDHEHGGLFSADGERKIFGHFAAEAASKEASLDKRNDAQWHGLLQQWVGQFLLLALLPSYDHRFAGVAFQ